MAVFSIGFAAEGGDFKSLATDNNDDDAEGFAMDFNRMPAFFFGNSPYIFWPGRRGNVVIMRLFPHEQVAHSTADDIGFKACIF